MKKKIEDKVFQTSEREERPTNKQPNKNKTKSKNRKTKKEKENQINPPKKSDDWYLN